MLAKTQFPDLIESVSSELTPMVDTARSIKKEHPDAKVVFIGPCAAKKLEASRKTVRSDVDFVITFEELDAMFAAKGIDPNQTEGESSMHDAGDLIAAGELVAFPTETVYGLGGDALDPEASKKIYSAKGRPSDNPLIVHISDFSDLERIAKTVPEDARKLSDAFWPGPLTMIVEKGDAVPYATTGGMDTVAVRMPNHPIALDLIRRSGCLIAAPSANTSGRPSPTEAAHVAEDLSGKIAMIIDGGPVGIGIESTIIDLTEDTPMVLRPGYITPQMLSKVLGKEVIVDPGIIAADDTRKPKAPGMKYKHYAPKADMVIVDGTRKHVIAKINELVASHRDDGKKIAVIATEETKQFYDADVVLSMGSRADEDSIAHELYRILRDCDELDVDVIFSESFSTPRIGQAIMNRMLKAAGHQVIDTHVKYDKIIFVAQTGTCREQMAKGIMNDFVLKVPMEIEARGLVVQFPEPVNQKAEAVLISNGISTEGMVSTQLEESDITESTMVFTMESSQRERIIESFADIDPEQVFVLSQYVGDELEILDPYGGTLQSYGLCYESLRATLKKLVKRLNANT